MTGPNAARRARGLPPYPDGLVPVDLDRPPYATIRKVGRWTYAVRIRDGISACGPYPGGSWHVLGYKRAEKFAQRQLARYLAAKATNQPVWIITHQPKER